MVDNIEEPNEQIEEQDNFADDSQDPPIEDATRYIVKVSVVLLSLVRTYDYYNPIVQFFECSFEM